MKMHFWETSTFLEKTPTRVFFCEIYKRFNSNYFEEHLWTSASKLFLKRDSNTGVFLWILCIIQEHLFCRRSMNGWFWNTSAGSLFNKVASLTAWMYLTVLEREALPQEFLCEFCEIFRKAFSQKISYQPCLIWCCFFFPFCRLVSLQPKINLFVGALVN